MSSFINQLAYPILTMRKYILLLCYTFFAFVAKAQHFGNDPDAGRYYNIRGIKMYTEVYGTGQPLLLIHGNGGSISAFAQTIPYFLKKYQVIAVDSRAHGKTIDPSDSLSFEQMADDFSELLDVMQIKKAYVIGWSDGGINALVLAMRHPDKVIKLASTGANLWPDSTGIVPNYWLNEQKHYEAYKNTIWKTDKEKNAWKIFMLDWNQPHIPFTALKAIQCPSLIISGDRDLIPLEHTLKVYQHIPKAWLWIVPNSGHATLKEHRDEFNKKVDDFFTSSDSKW